MTSLDKIIIYFYAVVIIIFICINAEACEKSVELDLKKDIVVLVCCDDIFFNPETGKYQSGSTTITKKDESILDVGGLDIDILCDLTRRVL